jgi:hypothetical protein
VTVQNLQNASSLANIQANGVINTQIQTLTNNNKTLLQTSQGAATLYNQALSNLSAIMTNPNLNTDQQTTALNNGVKQLQDGLTALNSIAANQQANSLLTFGNPAAPPPAANANVAAAGGTGVDQAIAGALGGGANAPSGSGGGT